MDPNHIGPAGPTDDQLDREYPSQEAELEDLRATADTMSVELVEARHAAVVAQMERDQAMSLAGSYLEHLDALKAHLADVRSWAQPATLFSGELDETAETWTSAPGMLQAVTDWEARAHRAEATLEEARANGESMLAHANDRADQAETRAQDLERRLEVLQDNWRRADREGLDLAREGDRLRQSLADVEAAVRKWVPGSDDLVERIMAELAPSSTTVDNPGENSSGEPDAQLPRWTTVAGDTWVEEDTWDRGRRWRLEETTNEQARVGACLYLRGRLVAAVTPEDLNEAATNWADLYR